MDPVRTDQRVLEVNQVPPALGGTQLVPVSSADPISLPGGFAEGGQRLHFVPPSDPFASKPLLETISRVPREPAFANPVVFIHGSGLTAQSWDLNIQPYLMAQGVEVHSLSLRGHGKSQGAGRLFTATIATHVDDIKETIHRLGLQRPVLIGQSIGGLIAQKYAEKYDVSGLALLSSVPPSGTLRHTLRFLVRHPGTVIKAFCNWSLGPLTGSDDLLRESLFSKATPQVELDRFKTTLGDGPFTAFVQSLWPFTVRPSAVKAPTVVLRGGDDPLITRRDAIETARAYRTTVQTIPGVAHDMMLSGNWRGVADRLLLLLSQRV